MIKFIRIAREINDLVNLVNDVLKTHPKDGPSYSYFLLNRSFLVPFFTGVINVIILLNFPMLAPLLDFFQLVPPDMLAAVVISLTTTIGVVWAFLERAFGKTYVIFTRKQAAVMVEETIGQMMDENDDLSVALRKAMN